MPRIDSVHEDTLYVSEFDEDGDVCMELNNNTYAYFDRQAVTELRDCLNKVLENDKDR